MTDAPFDYQPFQTSTQVHKVSGVSRKSTCVTTFLQQVRISAWVVVIYNAASALTHSLGSCAFIID
jgi:hypothetical protein